MARTARMGVVLVVSILGLLVAVPGASATAPDEFCSTEGFSSNLDRTDAREALRNGLSDFFEPGEDPGETFSVRQVICEDLDGDGLTEVVVAFVCCTVSSPRPWLIFRRTSAASGASLRAAFGLLRGSYVQTLEIREGPRGLPVVFERRLILRSRDANCCPRGGSIYRQIGWDGSSFRVLTSRTVRAPVQCGRISYEGPPPYRTEGDAYFSALGLTCRSARIVLARCNRYRRFSGWRAVGNNTIFSLISGSRTIGVRGFAGGPLTCAPRFS